MITFIIVLLFLLILAVVGLLVFNKIKGQAPSNSQTEDKKINTTQNQLPFEYIRKGVVKLKNGQFVKLIEVPSINTQLMEEDEKEVVRLTYAALLNSIDFKIQFYKQSRLVDINDYLLFVKERESAINNDFKARGLREYGRFIQQLIKENSVQTKRDYIVISWSEYLNKKGKNQTKDEIKKYRKGEEDNVHSDDADVMKEERLFEKAYKSITQREKALQKQLRRLGMNSESLNDKELFELYYVAYNKERSVYQSLKGVNPKNFTSLYIKKG